jgi:DNA repair protein RadC
MSGAIAGVAGELTAELAHENGADVATSIQLANLSGAISSVIYGGLTNQSDEEMANNAWEGSRIGGNAAQNNLQKFSKLSVADILGLKIKGIGKIKAIRILAAIELGSRRMYNSIDKKNIRQSKDVADHLKYLLQFESRELFMVLLLNQANKVIHEEILSEGGITGTVADPRIIFKLALSHEATGFIICHNHPSGQLKPSNMDDILTEKIKKGAAYFDIKLIDHLIVSTEGYYSYAEQSLNW